MKIQAITKDVFGTKSWIRSPSYAFAATHSVSNLTLQELPQAAQSMPIAFFRNNDLFTVVAVQSLQPTTNYFLNAEGRWLGRYIPASYRTYPFMLVPNTEDPDQLILCIDADCGLIAEEATGEPFFDDQGGLSETLVKLMDYLKDISNSRTITDRICEVLQKHKLIKPWDVQIKLESGVHRVDGLFCIDESALNDLPDADFAEVRQSGALPVIYCQLLSMLHIAALTQIAQKNLSAPVTPAADIDELDFDSMNSDGNIRFDNL